MKSYVIVFSADIPPLVTHAKTPAVLEGKIERHVAPYITARDFCCVIDDDTGEGRIELMSMGSAGTFTVSHVQR